MHNYLETNAEVYRLTAAMQAIDGQHALIRRILYCCTTRKSYREAVYL